MPDSETINNISIKAELDEVYDYLTSLGGGFTGAAPKIQQKMLSTVASKAAAKARNAYFGTGLKSGTGDLKKSIKSKVFKYSKAAIVGPWAHAPSNKIYYGFPQAYGSEIKPKNGDYMKFQINGKWVTKGPYQLTPRDIVEGPVTSFMNSPASSALMEKTLQKEIQKIEKKGGYQA